METETCKATHNQDISESLDKSAIELLDDLITEEKSNQLQSGEFTLAHYITQMKASGVDMADSTARRKLARLTGQGKIQWRWIKCNGRDARAYSKANNDEQNN